jgi:hypothetical protein
VSGYEIVRAPASVSPAGVNTGGRVTGIAICPAGKRVISGGFDANYTQTQSSSGLVSSSSFPLTDASWQVTMRNPGGFAVTGVTVFVYAICVSQ